MLAGILEKSYPPTYENQYIILCNILIVKMSDISLWTTEQYLKLSIYLHKNSPNGSDSDVSPQPRIQFSKLSVVLV